MLLKKINVRYLSIGITLLIVVGSAIFWFHRSGLLWAIPRFLRSTGPWGIGISYGLVLIQSVVPYAPFALIAGFNTSAHGFWIGYLVSFAGVVTGNLILYALAKQIIRIIFHEKKEHIWEKYPRLEVIRKKVVYARFWSAFSILFILRVQPWVPSSMLDILSGAAGVRIKPFLFSTLAGQAPVVAAMAYLGHRLLNIQKYKKEIIWAVVIIICIGIGYLLWKISRKTRQYDR